MIVIFPNQFFFSQKCSIIFFQLDLEKPSIRSLGFTASYSLFYKYFITMLLYCMFVFAYMNIIIILIYCTYIFMALTSQQMNIKHRGIGGFFWLNEWKSVYLPEEESPSLQKKLNYLLMTILGCQVKGGHSLLITFIQKSCVFHVSDKSLTSIDAPIALQDAQKLMHRN